MEKLVRGIRETYFDDMIADYREEREKSFLYRTFWAESVRELLKKSLPPLPKKNELRKQMEELDKGFLRPLAEEESGQEQMEEHFARLSEEVKELLEIHLPQLPACAHSASPPSARPKGRIWGVMTFWSILFTAYMAA